MSKNDEIKTETEITVQDDKSNKRKKIFRLLFTISIVLVFLAGIYVLLKVTGLWDRFDTPEEIKEWILSFGVWSRLIFITLQFLQVSILPIPAIITTVAGALIFGPLQTFVMSTLAIITGSVLAFYLGRWIGKPIVNYIVGEQDAKKWSAKLARGKYVFFFMMLFPLFPDDILCMVAGVTNMSFRFFLITNIITRPINTFVMCFITSGDLIPFNGWGIPVWILLIIGCAVLFYLSVKYQKEIEEYVGRISDKATKKSKKRKNTK